MVGDKGKEGWGREDDGRFEEARDKVEWGRDILGVRDVCVTARYGVLLQ